MTDRELLEAAAKAVGYEIPITSPWGGYSETIGLYQLCMDGSKIIKQWNPLTSDADAFRLIVDMDINVQFYRDEVFADARTGNATSFYTDHNNDKYAATRRAIVRAAAGE